MKAYDQELNECLQSLQRPINCLIDEDLKNKRYGLNKINNYLFKKPDRIIIKIFYTTALAKNLCRAIESKQYAARYSSLGILKKYLTKIKSTPDIDTSIVYIFLKTLIGRVNSQPFNETSEYLRLTIVYLFEDFSPYVSILTTNISYLANALAKCLADAFPDLKKATCTIINHFSKHLRYSIGHHASAILSSLATNCTHQHSRVRRCSIYTIGYLMVTEGCSQYIYLVQAAIKNCTFDKVAYVRKASFECIAKLLNGFSIKALKSHEYTLVSYLLNGLSDESPDISKNTMELLNEVGRKRRDLEMYVEGVSQADIQPS